VIHAEAYEFDVTTKAQGAKFFSDDSLLILEDDRCVIIGTRREKVREDLFVKSYVLSVSNRRERQQIQKEQIARASSIKAEEVYLRI
jgi:hypothetical protein